MEAVKFGRELFNTTWKMQFWILHLDTVCHFRAVFCGLVRNPKSKIINEYGLGAHMMKCDNVHY